MANNYRLDRSYRISHGRLIQTRNGRSHSHIPDITLIDDLHWRKKDEKKGTIRLDQVAYSLAGNDLPGIVPLHLNENLFQAAQKATSQSDIADLIQDVLNQIHSYPKGGAKELQEALAAHFAIAPHKLIIGHGSSAVLRDLFLYLLRQGDKLLMPAPGWSYYKALANLVEAHVDTFPLAENGHSFAYDACSIATKIGATQPKAVLICSPNNPTGSVMPIEDFIWLAKVYPQVNFILDEAYYGFADSYSAEQEKLLLTATEQANVFLVRTFSKFYGLANLRVGFAVCNETNGRNLNKIAPVFGLPTFSQAVAAQRLANEQFAVEMKQEYAAVNDFVFNALSQIPGLFPYQTAANFILVKHDGRWQEIEKTLLAQGYMIKRETINGDKNYIRIAYADMATMQHLISLIQSFI